MSSFQVQEDPARLSHVLMAGRRTDVCMQSVLVTDKLVAYERVTLSCCLSHHPLPVKSIFMLQSEHVLITRPVTRLDQFPVAL